MLNTRTCGTNRMSSDINGPPNVEPKSRSAPGAILRKNGIYSISAMTSTPPTIISAFRHQQPIKPAKPGLYVASQREDAMILLLLRIKNSAKTGMYTQNWPRRAASNVLKNGQMKRKSSRNTFSQIKSRRYIYASMQRTSSALRPRRPQPIFPGASAPASPMLCQMSAAPCFLAFL